LYFSILPVMIFHKMSSIGNLQKTTLISLDLGTTVIKAARICDDASIDVIKKTKAPELEHDDLICEGSVLEYEAIVTDLLYGLIQESLPQPSVCLASQRSTFVLWDSRTGQALTPMISWQDRRAHSWCEQNKDLSDHISRITGLLLSPHYIGPKLAVLFAEDLALKKCAEKGDCLLGTLDAYLVWKWTKGRIHETDLTMAARTCLVDIGTGEWDAELLKLFGIPENILPSIQSSHKNLSLPFGATLKASLSDQAANLLCFKDLFPNVCSINLGTGGFIIKPEKDQNRRMAGYLMGPVSEKWYALEGTMNGIAKTLSKYPYETIPLADTDPEPEGFCLPDSTGIGAPHWRADINMSLSINEDRLSSVNLRRIVLEGILFRIYEIYQDMTEANAPDTRVFLSGGLCGEPMLAGGLVELLGRPISIVEEKETTLLGAAHQIFSTKKMGTSKTPDDQTCIKELLFKTKVSQMEKLG